MKFYLIFYAGCAFAAVIGYFLHFFGYWHPQQDQVIDIALLALLFASTACFRTEQ